MMSFRDSLSYHMPMTRFLYTQSSSTCWHWERRHNFHPRGMTGSPSVRSSWGLIAIWSSGTFLHVMRVVCSSHTLYDHHSCCINTNSRQKAQLSGPWLSFHSGYSYTSNKMCLLQDQKSKQTRLNLGEVEVCLLLWTNKCPWKNTTDMRKDHVLNHRFLISYIPLTLQ